MRPQRPEPGDHPFPERRLQHRRIRQGLGPAGGGAEFGQHGVAVEREPEFTRSGIAAGGEQGQLFRGCPSAGPPGRCPAPATTSAQRRRQPMPSGPRSIMSPRKTSRGAVTPGSRPAMPPSMVSSSGVQPCTSPMAKTVSPTVSVGASIQGPMVIIRCRWCRARRRPPRRRPRRADRPRHRASRAAPGGRPAHLDALLDLQRQPVAAGGAQQQPGQAEIGAAGRRILGHADQRAEHAGAAAAVRQGDMQMQAGRGAAGRCVRKAAVSGMAAASAARIGQLGEGDGLPQPPISRRMGGAHAPRRSAGRCRRPPPPAVKRRGCRRRAGAPRSPPRSPARRRRARAAPDPARRLVERDGVTGDAQPPGQQHRRADIRVAGEGRARRPG